MLSSFGSAWYLLSSYLSFSSLLSYAEFLGVATGKREIEQFHPGRERAAHSIRRRRGWDGIGWRVLTALFKPFPEEEDSLERHNKEAERTGGWLSHYKTIDFQASQRYPQ